MKAIIFANSSRVPAAEYRPHIRPKCSPTGGTFTVQARTFQYPHPAPCWRVKRAKIRCMQFIRRYKNILLSIGFYVLAFFLFWLSEYLFIHSGVSFWPPTPESSLVLFLSNNVPFFLLIVFIVIGILFSFRSKKLNESSWTGILLGVVGILALLISIGLYFLALTLNFSPV